ncbi:hypothetical protein [Helicobacter cynogastricus]|uniref:hypothetical protein n=1 Tax=Helicobacter cynogastricus TaxID=329937 RepID=UPI000CF07B51|nr:hypothetical protein [Helicobacter cynogastricus]
MRYSYSKPGTKRMVSLHTKVWVFYMVLAICLSAWAGHFLEQNTESSNQESAIAQMQNSIYGHEIDRLKIRQETIKKQLQDVAYRVVYNANIKSAIKGILQIIPDSITIQSITIDYSSLVIKGVVSSKEAFQLSLQQRLNSIFENNQVTFYPISNGWRFVSSSSSSTSFIEKRGD